VTRYTPIEPLDDQHVLDGFRCSDTSLDEWLVDHARANQAAGFSRTYVTTDSVRVVGFHAVSSFAILRSDATRRAARRGPRQIPAILLGRLAVDEDHQGRDLGAALLRHAMTLAVAAGDTVGVRVMVVNALHERAAGFYEHFGFTRSPTNPLDLMMTVNDIAASMEDGTAPG